MKAPCMNCEERATACWSSCEKYKAWRKPIDEANQKRYAKLEANNAIHEIVKRERTKRK